MITLTVDLIYLIQVLTVRIFLAKIWLLLKRWTSTVIHLATSSGRGGVHSLTCRNPFLSVLFLPNKSFKDTVGPWQQKTSCLLRTFLWRWRVIGPCQDQRALWSGLHQCRSAPNWQLHRVPAPRCYGSLGPACTSTGLSPSRVLRPTPTSRAKRQDRAARRGARTSRSQPRLLSTDNREPPLTLQPAVPALVPQARGAPAHIWLCTRTGLQAPAEGTQKDGPNHCAQGGDPERMRRAGGWREEEEV